MRGPDCLDEILVELLGQPLPGDWGIVRPWVDACCLLLIGRPVPVRERWFGCMVDKFVRAGLWNPEPAARPVMLGRLARCFRATEQDWQREQAGRLRPVAQEHRCA